MISFDLSATLVWPSTRRCLLDHAEIMWIGALDAGLASMNTIASIVLNKLQVFQDTVIGLEPTLWRSGAMDLVIYSVAGLAGIVGLTLLVRWRMLAAAERRQKEAEHRHLERLRQD